MGRTPSSTAGPPTGLVDDPESRRGVECGSGDPPHKIYATRHGLSQTIVLEGESAQCFEEHVADFIDPFNRPTPASAQRSAFRVIGEMSTQGTQLNAFGRSEIKKDFPVTKR